VAFLREVGAAVGGAGAALRGSWRASASAYNPAMLEITPEAVKAKLDAGEKLHLIDVREDQELAICSLPGAEHIPMMSLFLGLKKTAAAQDTPVVVICHHGIRSLEATQFLKMQGFEDVKSMSGGVDEWARKVDPTLPRY